MTKPQVILSLLKSLREGVELLRPVKSESLEEMTADLIRYNGVIHLMQTSIEHVTDVCAHLLAGSGAEVPDGYREIIQKAGEYEFLPIDFAQRIAPMAGFRNIVVHNYLTVDPALVRKYLQENLGDFEQFIEYIFEYMKKEGMLE